ncbi:MAG: preprotein translocase subunit SecE [Gammaproteobacteria bacterium]|nr:preprotein translocase subunit SecE [Gammaproteobacteria bacterium]
MDTMLLGLSLLLLAGGIFGFYYFESQALPVIRVVGLFAAMALALAIAAFTVRGRAMLQFFRNADIERRKVVWPTRPETVQTTIMVLIVTLIVAAILFLFDSLLSVIVRAMMTGG